MQDHETRIREEFSRQADTMALATFFTDEQILARIRDAMGMTRPARVLDLACGPGIVSAALAPHAGEVIAFDITPEMLRRVQRRCTTAGLTNVRCVLGRGEALPFPSGHFDVVVTRSAIHHFPHPAATMAEMARVTRTAGRIVIVDVVSSEEPEASALHNALEVLRDPSHVRMLPQTELLALLGDAKLAVQSVVKWTHQREFDEWLQIANAPERIAPLRAVMTALAQAGVQAGINLHVEGDRVMFDHTTLLITAEKAA